MKQEIINQIKIEQKRRSEIDAQATIERWNIAIEKMEKTNTPYLWEGINFLLERRETIGQIIMNFSRNKLNYYIETGKEISPK